MATVSTNQDIDLREGDCIGGCRIAKLLGAGAMGAVYEAHQVSLDRRVAFKILMPRKKEHLEVLRSRFIQEARLAARVNHQNIVQIFDVGEERGVPYIIMEYAEAVTLKDLLRKQPRFPVTRLYRMAVKVARGLAAAHQENVAHRDIKPDNILVTSRGEIKIADFGAAGLAVGDESERCLIGTPAFMAPEVIRRERSDGRADIYALGLILYKAASGRHPFMDKNVHAVLKSQIQKPLPPLNAQRPALAEEFVRLIEKLCSKQAHERYDSATLVDILEHHPIWENPVAPEDDGGETDMFEERAVAADAPSELITDEDAGAAKQTIAAFSAEMTRDLELEDVGGSEPSKAGSLLDVPLLKDRSERTSSPVTQTVEVSAERRTTAQTSDVISPIKKVSSRASVSHAKQKQEDPELQQLCIQARFQIMKKNWKRAETTYRTIVERDPQNETAVVGLARICASRGRQEEALTWLRQALENNLVNVDTVQKSQEFTSLAGLREFRELLAEHSI